MDKNVNIPRLRFPGFDYAWEQRKCSDFIKFVGGATPSKSNKSYWNGDIIWLSSQEINKGGFVDSGTYTITDKALDDGTTKLVKADTPLFISRSGILAHSFPITRPTKDVAINQDIKAMLFDRELYFTDFVVYMMENKADYILKSIVKSGTTVQSVSMPDMEKMEVCLPEIKEQHQIGMFFLNLDNLITLHQRKHDKLIDVKKSLLKKMFPRDGARVPQMRFPGFTDDWEQRKFGEILDEFSNRSKTENEYPVLSSTNTGMEFRDGRVSGTSNVGYKIIKNNDLVLSPQNLWLGNININDIGTGIVSPSYKTFKLKDIETDFFRPQIRTQYLMNEYYNASIQGASVVRRNLDNEKFNAISIYVPSSSEQVAIGCFFRNLDNLITLHQRKCDQYKELKNGLLQQVFV